MDSMERLRESLNQRNQSLEGATPQDILRWAAECYCDQLAVVTSFQPTGIVTLHMLSTIAPQTTILTLDTGNLFPETYALMDKLERLLKLNLVRVRPAQTLDEQAQVYGDALWQTQPDLCCYLRKVTPLGDALHGFRAWITGLRRDQSVGRAQTPLVSWDERYQKVKVTPFATWTESMIWTYIRAHDLPYNILHDRGYPSIGCTHCTQPIMPGDDPRAGRWSNHSKTECGLHTKPDDRK